VTRHHSGPQQNQPGTGGLASRGIPSHGTNVALAAYATLPTICRRNGLGRTAERGDDVVTHNEPGRAHGGHERPERRARDAPARQPLVHPVVPPAPWQVRPKEGGRLERAAEHRDRVLEGGIA